MAENQPNRAFVVAVSIYFLRYSSVAHTTNTYGIGFTQIKPNGLKLDGACRPYGRVSVSIIFLCIFRLPVLQIHKTYVILKQYVMQYNWTVQYRPNMALPLSIVFFRIFHQIVLQKKHRIHRNSIKSIIIGWPMLPVHDGARTIILFFIRCSQAIIILVTFASLKYFLTHKYRCPLPTGVLQRKAISIRWVDSKKHYSLRTEIFYKGKERRYGDAVFTKGKKRKN